MYPSLVFEFSFVSFLFTFFSFYVHFYSSLSSFYAVKPLSYLFFGYIFPDVVETSSNLAVDAAGVAGHMAPESAGAGIPAPDLAPVDAGEVEEMHPQVVGDAPSQLIKEICNCVSYPHASKTTSQANPGVAEKRTTPACARQAVAQGNGGATTEKVQPNNTFLKKRGEKSDSQVNSINVRIHVLK